MKEDFAQDMKELKEVLDSMDTPSWLIGGVLLGHVRDGDFLEWDDDIDIAIRHPCIDIPEPEQRAWLEKWVQPIRDAGFRVVVSYPKLLFGWIIAAYKRTKTDMMVWEEYNSDLCYGYTNHYLCYPKRMFTDMDTINIQGTDYNIPTPVNEFLDMKFGDWRTVKAPISERRKTLSKSEYLDLRDSKLLWRDDRERIFLNRDLLKDMDNYYSTVTYIAGCWDLFHIGHLRALIKACSFGHKFIVGVATDEYYQRYKNNPPAIPYVHRRDIISRIKGVYMVIPHDEKNSVDVYDKYGVTNLVISDDYTDTPSHNERLEEARKRGISITVVPTTKDIHSTSIKEKIATDWRKVYE